MVKLLKDEHILLIENERQELATRKRKAIDHPDM